jgi:hypothetical protein
VRLFHSQLLTGFGRRTFRFTIRDLLWLTVVVALAVAWWIDHHRLTEAIHQDDDFTISGMREVQVPIIQFSAPSK